MVNNIDKLMDEVREAQSNLVGYFLDQLEAQYGKNDQFKALRKLVLNQAGSIMRELERRLTS